MNFTLQQLDDKYNTMVNDLDKLFKIIELNEVKLMVFSNGKIFRWIQPKEPDIFIDNKLTFKLGIPYWKYVEENKMNDIRIKDKMINKAKVIASAFLNYDVNDKEMCVAHINGDKYDNRVENLKEIYHYNKIYPIVDAIKKLDELKNLENILKNNFFFKNSVGLRITARIHTGVLKAIFPSG